MTTLDGLVTALSEQGGWVDVTAPSDISVDGYAGQAFQRTRPRRVRRTAARRVRPRSGAGRTWTKTETRAGRTTNTGEIETLWVLDLDGTVVIINTRVGSDQPAAAHAEFAAVLDSIRIDQASSVTMSSVGTPSTGDYLTIACSRLSAARSSPTVAGRLSSTSAI